MSCARTEILLGLDGIEKLWHQHVLIVGVGGVGCACAEALCRAGVGKMTLIDHDDISETNLNRLIIALHSTIGKPKVEVLRQRLLDISPSMELNTKRQFVDESNVEQISQDSQIDFVVDCIDSISSKATLIASCQKNNKKIISAMGAGGKLDPTRVKIISLNQTAGDGLARELRKSLRKLGVALNIPVVFSDEPGITALPHQEVKGNEVCPSGRARAVNGTISYMPNVFGLVMASFVVKETMLSLKKQS